MSKSVEAGDGNDPPFEEVHPGGEGAYYGSVEEEAEGKRHKGRNRLVSIGLAVVVVGVVAFFVARATFGGSSSGVVKPGNSAPAILLPGLNGNQISLASYRGKVVLVNFWATWCPPCQAEMPNLAQVYQQRKGEGFEILGVDQGESQDTVAGYLKSNQSKSYDWTIALDHTDKVSQDYGVYTLPTSFLIDRDGKIVQIWNTQVSQSSLDKALASLGITG